MEKFRIEHDSMGEIAVPANRYWGAQTERSAENFKIGTETEKMPFEIIRAFAYVKKAAAIVNNKLRPEKMTDKKTDIINAVCDEIIDGKLNEEFPLVIYQTGSGTQTNMNVNEVIANRGNRLAGEKLLHPNDDVNMSQSSNDTFPTAMYVAASVVIETKLKPALCELIDCLKAKEKENEGILKCGRTHLQDATPLYFSQEISGWRSSLERDLSLISESALYLRELALGGTAVGTGLNSPDGFDFSVAEEIGKQLGIPFKTAENKFHALTSKCELVAAHGALKALAADLFKIANDVRWLSSGPRLGLGEITIPANEPGSSIMPGKVNPTQCESVTMVCARVFGNDTTVGFAASQGNFELNVFMPVMIDAFLQSAKLLAESMVSFNKNCLSGMLANVQKMNANFNASLMSVTVLNPYIGYEKAAKTAQFAHKNGLSLRESCVQLGYLSTEEFDEIFIPEKLVNSKIK